VTLRSTHTPFSTPPIRGLPGRSRSPFAVLDVLRPTVARASSWWRPLLWFWLAILAVAATGGAVLHRLGPLPERSHGDQARSEPQHPTEPRTVLALPAAVPPVQPGSAEPLARAPSAAEPSEPTPSTTAAAPPPAPATARTDPGKQPTVLPSLVRATNEALEGTRRDGRVLVTLHPAAGSGDGGAQAEQLASQAGLAPDQIGAGPASGLGRGAALIRFHSTQDHALARRLGQELAGMGYAWRIENLSDRSSPPGRQAVEVWLPER